MLLHADAHCREELSTLDSQIRPKFLFSMPDSLVLPETFSIDSLNAYINVFMTTNTQLFEDFATINFKEEDDRHRASRQRHHR